MGVPAFFRWLTKKYPATVVNANEDRQRGVDGRRVPVDCTQPNPNFQEFDNLYLDMNGIIHPCTHPEDRPAPTNEDEMFVLIFEYIDRIFSIVRPRRLLYMAIDGVAPRAKMNQQRSRRFRASKEMAEKAASNEEQRRRLIAEGIAEPPPKKEEVHFDSNCITPGTPFMARLADALRYYIHDRVTNDAAWANIEIILSDANVPGEGEHKIMDYIRKQRGNPAHDPNTVHCLCGADADLIMLGIATHEANFNIIREEFVPNQPRACELCGQYGHELKKCRGAENDTDLGDDYCKPEQREKNFIFLRIPVLREYLEKEMAMPNLPFQFNLERALDDWVFLCFFVGNDFLPHLPSLEIREGAIDRLIKLYKEMVYQMKGYLTKDGIPELDRVEMIMKGLGKMEDEIFKRRQQDEERFKENQKNKKARMQQYGRGRGRGRGRGQPAYVPSHGILAPMSAPMHHSGESTRQMASNARQTAMAFNATNDANAQAEANLNALLNVQGEQSPAEVAAQESRKRKAEQPIIITDEDDEPKDDIRLYESGWKDRYYRAKFDVGSDDTDFRHRVAWAYVEGLCWVLRYYYQGCSSWDWYFPYHYAPFASDFETVGQFKPDFTKPTKPFNPLEQLMSVFPAASKQHLPVEWQKLMIEADSPIIDLYPADFRIDLNGKKYAWQGVALLPFVDEKRLLETLKSVYPTLTDEEKYRNQRGPNRIFIGRNHKSFAFFQQVAESKSKDLVDLDPSLLNGVSGKIAYDVTATAPGVPFPSPVSHEDCQDLSTNCGICVLYEDPEYPEGYVFPAVRLDGAKQAEKTLRPEDHVPERDGRYRPTIGFNRNAPRGGLDQSDQRHINHHVRGAMHDRQGGDNYRGGYRGGYQGGYDDRRGGRGGGGGYRGEYNDDRSDFGRALRPEDHVCYKSAFKTNYFIFKKQKTLALDGAYVPMKQKSLKPQETKQQETKQKSQAEPSTSHNSKSQKQNSKKENQKNSKKEKKIDKVMLAKPKNEDTTEALTDSLNKLLKIKSINLKPEVPSVSDSSTFLTHLQKKNEGWWQNKKNDAVKPVNGAKNAKDNKNQKQQKVEILRKPSLPSNQQEGQASQKQGQSTNHQQAQRKKISSPPLAQQAPPGYQVTQAARVKTPSPHLAQRASPHLNQQAHRKKTPSPQLFHQGPPAVPFGIPMSPNFAIPPPFQPPPMAMFPGMMQMTPMGMHMAQMGMPIMQPHFPHQHVGYDGRRQNPSLIDFKPSVITRNPNHRVTNQPPKVTMITKRKSVTPPLPSDVPEENPKPVEKVEEPAVAAEEKVKKPRKKKQSRLAVNFCNPSPFT